MIFIFKTFSTGLTYVSEDEWRNVPEVGDARNRKMRNPRAEKFTPLPDSVLARNLGGDSNTSIDPSSGIASAFPSTSGFNTPGINYYTIEVVFRDGLISEFNGF